MWASISAWDSWQCPRPRTGCPTLAPVASPSGRSRCIPSAEQTTTAAVAPGDNHPPSPSGTPVPSWARHLRQSTVRRPVKVGKAPNGPKVKPARPSSPRKRLSHQLSGSAYPPAFAFIPGSHDLVSSTLNLRKEESRGDGCSLECGQMTPPPHNIFNLYFIVCPSIFCVKKRILFVKTNNLKKFFSAGKLMLLPISCFGMLWE